MKTLSTLQRNCLGIIGTLALLAACGGSGDQVFLQNESDPTTPNPGNLSAAVIGQTVTIIPEPGVSLSAPIQIQLVDSHDRIHSVAQQSSASALQFQVPPAVATGVAALHIKGAKGNTATGYLLLRRLGVVANRGSGSLLVFDVDHPELVIEVPLLQAGGPPEDVAISADGRTATIALAGNPSLVSLDLTKPTPVVSSPSFPLEAAPSRLALVKGSPLALAANYGDPANPGGSIDLFSLSNAGTLLEHLETVPVGTTQASGPFDLDILGVGSPIAAVSNRLEGSLDLVDLTFCFSQPSPGCAQSAVFSSTVLEEPTGLRFHPATPRLFVTDYQSNSLHWFDPQNGTYELSGSLPLIGGDEGPVALRITPGGGMALVLNEISDSLSLIDLAQGPPLFSSSLALPGSGASKMTMENSGTSLWISFSDSNEIRKVALNQFTPLISPPVAIPGLNNPRGIAIQP